MKNDEEKIVLNRKEAQAGLQEVIDEMTRADAFQDEHICCRCCLPADDLKPTSGGGGLCHSCL